MSAILHENEERSNYAAERLVGHQDIDPNSSGESAGFHGWRRKIWGMPLGDIARLICELEDKHAGDLAIVGKALADAEQEASKYKTLFNIADDNYKALQAERDLALHKLGDLQVKFDVLNAANTEHTRRMAQYMHEANELDQGCSWLASQLRYEEADNDANQIDYLDMNQGCSDLVRRCQEAESEIAALKEQLARINGMDDFTKATVRDIIMQRDFYRTERDMLEASLKQWQDEAAQKQAKVIVIADGAAQLRAVILTLADGLHYSQGLEAWVLKGPLGDLLRELADALRNQG